VGYYGMKNTLWWIEQKLFYLCKNYRGALKPKHHSFISARTELLKPSFKESYYGIEAKDTPVILSACVPTYLVTGNYLSPTDLSIHLLDWIWSWDEELLARTKATHTSSCIYPYKIGHKDGKYEEMVGKAIVKVLK
jgi:hypothetical protein